MLHGYHVISLCIRRSVISAVSRNRGMSWNVLPADTGVILYLILDFSKTSESNTCSAVIMSEM